jgi:ankyrin repeat protein
VQIEWERAARNGDTAALARLAGSGVDVDCRDAHGQTALMLAARAGHSEAVRWLVRRGADLNHSAKFRLTALMLAIVNGHADAALALIDAGASLVPQGSGAPGFAGKTALDLARERGDAHLVAVIEHRLAGPN